MDLPVRVLPNKPKDVTCGFRDLVVTALQMDLVVEEAQQLAVQVMCDELSNGPRFYHKKCINLKDNFVVALSSKSFIPITVLSLGICAML